MADLHVKNKNRFEIDFPKEGAQDWSNLAHLIFNKKRHISELIEKEFDVTFEKPASINPISNPITSITFWGAEDSSEKIMKTLKVLMSDLQERKYFSREAVADIVAQINITGTYVSKQFNKSANDNVGRSKGFEAKNENQQAYADLIDNNTLIFGIGPAGTGKTHVAVVKAIEAMKSGKIKKILLARPAVESGEKLGFLPGDQNQKLAPYMRPIYDELDKAFGPGKYKQMLENGTIEIVPIGYMRGRTFENAFIILDEAQNASREQVKMAMTRIGPGSKMVINGDESQVDLPKGVESGLMFAVNLMQGAPNVGVHAFDDKDVVRSEIVMEITRRLREKEGFVEVKPTTTTPKAPQP